MTPKCASHWVTWRPTMHRASLLPKTQQHAGNSRSPPQRTRHDHECPVRQRLKPLLPAGPQEKYYSEKLGLTRKDAAKRRAVVEEYIRGLHWVLEYYYRCRLAACLCSKCFGQSNLGSALGLGFRVKPPCSAATVLGIGLVADAVA